MKVDITNALPFISEEKMAALLPKINELRTQIWNNQGKGNDFLGWKTLPEKLHQSELLKDIKNTAQQLREKVDIFVVVGIGGSYLGARAVIEALKHSFSAFGYGKTPEIIYAGHHLNEDYLAELVELLDQKDYALTIISKSGTTTEPAVAFRILKQHLEKKYGQAEAQKRIIAITDKEKGALKKLSNQEGYKTFVVPDDVGGRYSMLTPVGLLPIAVAGFDIDAIIEGALAMQKDLQSNELDTSHPLVKYVGVRNLLYQKGKFIEMMINYHPKLQYFTEWWKQLYGESEGKEGKGIFPAGAGFTTDLHSMGQYIQEGERILFETVLSIENPNKKMNIPTSDEDLDGLNYIAKKSVDEVNKQAELGVVLAHVDGKVPNIKISIPKLDEYNLGALIYFYEMSCAISGYLLDINPFNQPGVEAYKRNMFALLGKPNYEAETQKIRERLKIGK